jgi:undecaprenyl-phosphate 4-deoxy-4-formamido-L-arabinose transferase
MILTSGTRGLRLVSALGAAFAVVGVLLAIYVVIARLFNQVSVQGWASVMVAFLLGTGAILFALGIIAEYIGVAVNMAMGKPLYLIVSDPADSPLSRRPSAPHE